MKNKRQLKAEKSQRLAKSVAKKVAAENSSPTIKNKSRNQPELTDAMPYDSDEKNKKINKQAKRAKVEKDHMQESAGESADGNAEQKAQRSNSNAGKMPIYDELPVQDLQRYLETLPSPEIRHFIEGLIVQDKFNMLPIDVTAAIGDMEKMQYYFMRDPVTKKSRYDPNGRCLDGGTPLHSAIKAKHKESVQLLIENGADLSLVDFMGDNAIMAAIKAGVANMINILWPYKANLDVNHSNTIGKRALHLAAERSWEGCVRFLLSNRACPDVKDRDLVTPLMIAAQKGDLKIVDSLVKAGADIGLEDANFDTAVSKALYKEHQPVLDCMLKSLDEGRCEVYVKDLVYTLMNPPLPEPEYALLEVQYVPMLNECTKHPEYRNSFYNQRVVNSVVVRMKHRARQCDSMSQIGCLLLNIFFRFGSEIDVPFVRQFFSSGAPKFILTTAQTQMSEYNSISSLQVFFPMIGLVEIPEGRHWIWKNILDVSEYFNHFDKNQLAHYLRDENVEWFHENGNIKEIKRVWFHFYNEVNRMQTEQREKHMRELLQQEENDKSKKERRQEKIKQKREEKLRLQESSATTELMELWSSTAPTDEELTDSEDGVSTCRNANAIVGLSSEAITDVVVTTGNATDYLNISSQSLDSSSCDSFRWMCFQGEPVFSQLHTGDEDDWTTVQTKKNKDKDKHIPERQTIARSSPVQNSKRKKYATQKQKKKKDSKPIQVPLNAFTASFPAPALGSTRWADVAKGVTKSIPQAELNVKNVPEAKQAPAVTQTETANLNKQSDFPTLATNPMQWDKREKPNKMTFHFHTELSEYDSNSRGDILDESVDIEQAELELQELEASTGSEIVSVDIQTGVETNIRPSQTSECFMCDPEYTDESKGEVFDPTRLTDEEISSFNSRGKVSAAEYMTAISDHVQCGLEPGLDRMRENRNNFCSNQQWMKNIELANSKEEQDDKPEVHLKTSFQNENYVSRQCTTHTDTGTVLNSSPRRQEEDGFHVDRGGSDNSPLQTTDHNGMEKRTAATVPVANIHDPEKDYFLIPNTNSIVENRVKYQNAQRRGGSKPTTDFSDEAAKQLNEHQTTTYAEFEEQLKHHASEHFIELVVTLSPISEPKPNIIDDLFNTPGEIPEWLNEDEEIPKEEDVWNEMTSHSTPVKELSDPHDKQWSDGNCRFMENSNDTEMPQTQYAPRKKEPTSDLSVTDPAIIRCSKKQANIVDQKGPDKGYEKASLHYQPVGVVPQQLARADVCATQMRTQMESLYTKNNIELELVTKSSNGEKPAAVVKPLSLHSSTPLPAVNCAFGQKLLENACHLENEDSNEDSFLYPDDLNGEPYKEDAEQTKTQTPDDDEFYFPSFHEDTMLSGHHNDKDVSVAHRMQQIQLEQIRDYYRRCKDLIMDGTSMEQSRFLLYAQSAGMEKDRIDQYLQGKVEVEQKEMQKRSTAYPTLPTKPGIALTGTETRAPVTTVQPVPVQNPKSQVFGPQNGTQDVTKQQNPTLPVVPYVLLRPFLPPASHPANIRNIQNQQAAMSSSVKMKIQEIIESMFKAKAKSVRWMDELIRMRNFPSEKLTVVGKIVIPKDECDRVYIAYHGTGATILGYLCDGSEVAVKIMNCKLRPIKPDDIEKLLSVDSSQPFVNRYRAIEKYDGYYYIAMDLYEYSLPEYLHIIHKDDTIDEKIAKEKLVFQLLRGFLALHQTYLLLHAELRPENLVIDTDGNLRVAGYGIGRNTERDPERYSEYCDEDKCWLAPEVLVHRKPITFKMDIFVVGMMIYYMYKGGKNPFGSEPREIIQNICTQNYVMEYINEEAGHLLSMMLSINKIDRPAIGETLKHPLFWADEKKLRFVSIVGSDIVWELKHSFMLDKKQRDNSMAAIISMAPCNINVLRWMQAIEPIVMKEMKGFRQYKNTLADLVVFLYNCCNHFQTLSPKVREIIDEPCRYFLTKFPTLFMTVYRAIKFTNRRDKTCYKPFF